MNSDLTRHACDVGSRFFVVVVVIQAIFLIPLYTTFLNTLEPCSIISSFSSEFTRQVAILEDGPLSSFSFKLRGNQNPHIVPLEDKIQLNPENGI